MPEIELVRQMMALGMLLIGSYFDIKKREVSDLVWIIFGVAGAMLYLFEPAAFATVIYVGACTIIGISWILFKVFGQADSLALITLGIILPMHDGLPVGVAVAVATPVLVSACSLCRNVAYNISDLIRGKLFCGICESPYRKAIAFLALHRKRGHEKFVFQAQSGNKLVFHLRPNENLDYAGDSEGYVSSALPLIPFMLASLVLILIL